ncbi:DUF3040 domain-containing protein [Nonomuraea aridisoli]|uniref:DUF3040 domain-containing protein n=1 Tax=Nonomuraea aridisoli TaxID=2070368 RepID=A0A2W2D4T3_9ACTN|nr:DUF3040 domain-containing protein [Nonomuraea aridisoli]PZG07022.1 hypothetical protein C1J01_41675 [Nonomuraea aridisoli]
MNLSPEERRALSAIETRLATEEPELDALLSGSRRRRPAGRSPLHLWCMLMLLTCAIFTLGVALLLATGERGCSEERLDACETVADTRAA